MCISGCLNSESVYYSWHGRATSNTHLSTSRRRETFPADQLIYFDRCINSLHTHTLNDCSLYRPLHYMILLWRYTILKYLKYYCLFIRTHYKLPIKQDLDRKQSIVRFIFVTNALLPRKCQTIIWKHDIVFRVTSIHRISNKNSLDF